jgi:DegV family protein with EDD domain
MIRIVTDSTCDLPNEVIKELNIAVVPLFINIGDKGFLDGVDISRKDFYTNLPDYPVHPTTGTPGTKAFTSTFEELTAAGADQILCIHISENLSATINVARSAAEEYQKAQVTVIDSGQLSLGTGFQVELAAKLAKDGKSLEEILSALKDLKSRTFVTAGLDTLEYLRRSGRMNRFMTGIGSLLKLKPILTMKNGLPGSERVRTIVKAEQRMLEMFKESHPFEKVAILHTNAQERAQDFLKKVSDLIPEGDIYSVDITPVIGSHIGPGAVGFAIISKKPFQT